MKSSKEKQSLISVAYKITNIEQFVQSIDRDMNTLAEQQESWREEKKQWDLNADKNLSFIKNRINTEFKDIENQLKKREANSREYIEKINKKIQSIFALQKQSQFKVAQMKKRLENIQQILGSN